ncbi:MAG: hypothetical protein C5B47_03185 [Verrucomicrobia bacterium]|nr:MAG: hypothetical protein C5B47_03185 [Verrucomicrobiota bacterium]
MMAIRFHRILTFKPLLFGWTIFVTSPRFAIATSNGALALQLSCAKVFSFSSRNLPTRLPPLEAGRWLARRLEARFLETYSSTGFKDDASLRLAIRNYGPEAARLLETVDSHSEFAVRVPQEVRLRILHQGFQNIHFTGKSRGTENNLIRNWTESAMLGLSHSEYTSLDPNIKPFYGYLRPSSESGLAQDRSTRDDDHDYGEDIYIFKKDMVDRIALHIGDSLGSIFNTNEDDHQPEALSWAGHFIPWKYRALIVPFLLYPVIHNHIGFYAQFEPHDQLIQDWSGLPESIRPPRPQPEPPLAPAPPRRPIYDGPPLQSDPIALMRNSKHQDFLHRYGIYLESMKEWELKQVAFERAYNDYLESDAYRSWRLASLRYKKLPPLHSAFKGTSLEPFRSGNQSGSIEILYLGPRNLDNVETFEFEEMPPVGEFLQELLSRRIRIRDGRGSIPVDWTPNQP